MKSKYLKTTIITNKLFIENKNILLTPPKKNTHKEDTKNKMGHLRILRPRNEKVHQNFQEHR
jgi:hypothetical protein